MLKLIFQSLLSPRLYKKYRNGPGDVYQVLRERGRSAGVVILSPEDILPVFTKPNNLEKWADLVIKTVNIVTSLSFYTSPFISLYIYLNDLYTLEKIQTLTPLFIGCGLLVTVSLIIRAVGRVTNPIYVEFLKTLNDATLNPSANLESLRKYDFEFYKWPISYTVPIKSSTWLETSPFMQCATPDLPAYKRIPLQVLAYAAVHTFGMKLIYPGTLSFIVTSLWRMLLLGRAQLVEECNGVRAKLRTADGNSIDTMFIDKRLSGSTQGKTLVICSEGNTGFYEIGIMCTPIRAGYSALGWNHPGFVGSTGTPFPSQEQNAIDAVMQYAINELGFRVEDIVLFGWSIGGYTATWAAVTYPEVKALVLDATFDDLLPIAQNQMPQSWALLIKEIIRSYVDLNISQMLRKYKGPVHLVRRTNDEVICLSEGLIHTNRGNYLVKKLIEERYPNLSKEELALFDKYICLISPQRAILEKRDIGESDRKILKLISKHMQDLNSTHCTPLPEDNFARYMDSLMEE